MQLQDEKEKKGNEEKEKGEEKNKNKNAKKILERKKGGKSEDRIKHIATRGVLVALAMVLSWIESLFPLYFFVPGMKLGLTNLVVLVALYRLSERDAFVINIIRIILVSLTFGNMFSLVYSLAGGMLSTIIMIMLKRKSLFTITTVSVVGGISHNAAQILVAAVLMRTKALIFYLGVLWVSGIVAGAIVGILCAAVIKRIPQVR